jgi:NAD(P)-dependent dehydrogenase (short-subunit alcohol dehydrogenase family)
MNLEESVFIITGGGSGLGLGAAEAFTSGGGRVVLADVNGEAAEAGAARLGDNARAAQCDVTDSDQVRGAIEMALDTWGTLHGAVNCAGIGTAVPVLGKKGPHPLDLFEKIIRVNLTGTFNVIRLCAAAMIDLKNDAEDRGVFISTASVAAFEGQFGQAAYAASKSGVMGMNLPIARELSRFGFRVMTIAPGLFDTPMFRGLPENIQESLVSRIPFPKRLGTPAEYGALARQIVENPMLNGATIRFDGALRMGT